MDNLVWNPVVTTAAGAKHQSMFYLRIAPGLPPTISAGDAETIPFINQGSGMSEISGRDFELRPNLGIYVRRNETFRIRNDAMETISVYFSAGPQIAAPRFDQVMLDNFDTSQPQRMADRSFQLLVDQSVGSRLVTQFIGNIPYSKATPHRHL